MSSDTIKSSNNRLLKFVTRSPPEKAVRHQPVVDLVQDIDTVENTDEVPPIQRDENQTYEFNPFEVRRLTLVTK